MASTLYKVLIVDDSPADIRLVLECLKDKYTLAAATTGEKAIELTSNFDPDIILMDVSMPIMNGYDTCKSILKVHDVSVIFLSANDTTEEIMRGYDAGGVDYIIKPFIPEILHSKIEFALKRKEKFKKPNAIADQLTPSDPVRILLDFNKKCILANTINELAALVISTCDQLNLESCVQLHSNSGIYESSSSGPVSKLESEILTRILQEEKRLFPHKHGLFVTFDNIALLVKNLTAVEPGPDNMKTSLSSLIENANTMLLNLDRIHSITQSNAESEVKIVQDMKSQTELLLEHLQVQKEFKKNSTKIMDEIIVNMESSFVDMGLTYNQEQALMTILNDGLDRSLKHFEQGVNLDEQFEALIKKMSLLVEGRE